MSPVRGIDKINGVYKRKKLLENCLYCGFCKN
jgi:hypothetical protein